MESCSIDEVRNVFGAEPVAVFATGVSTAQRFSCNITVTVALKFNVPRLTSFVLSYNGGNMDDNPRRRRGDLSPGSLIRSAWQ